MGIDKELYIIDKLLADYKGPEDLIGEQGLPKQLTKALVERAMHAELSHHLGYEKHDSGGKGSGNSRNGTSTKTLKGGGDRGSSGPQWHLRTEDRTPPPAPFQRLR
jgi:hypothetical protein